MSITYELVLKPAPDSILGVKLKRQTITIHSRLPRHFHLGQIIVKQRLQGYDHIIRLRICFPSPSYNQILKFCKKNFLLIKFLIWISTSFLDFKLSGSTIVNWPSFENYFKGIHFLLHLVCFFVGMVRLKVDLIM